jgi:hypothetical protein
VRVWMWVWVWVRVWVRMWVWVCVRVRVWVWVWVWGFRTVVCGPFKTSSLSGIALTQVRGAQDLG